MGGEGGEVSSLVIVCPLFLVERVWEERSGEERRGNALGDREGPGSVSRA